MGYNFLKTLNYYELSVRKVYLFRGEIFFIKSILHKIISTFQNLILLLLALHVYIQLRVRIIIFLLLHFQDNVAGHSKTGFPASSAAFIDGAPSGSTPIIFVCGENILK